MARFTNPHNQIRTWREWEEETAKRVDFLAEQFSQYATGYWANLWNEEGREPFDVGVVTAETREKVTAEFRRIQDELEEKEPIGDDVSYLIIAHEPNDEGRVEVKSVRADTQALGEFEPVKNKLHKRAVGSFAWERFTICNDTDSTVDLFMLV